MRIRSCIRFRSRSGLLIAHTDHGGPITLDFPAAPAVPAPVPDGLSAALGTEPRSVHHTGELGDLLTVLRDEPAVRALAPDMTAIARLTRRDGLRGIIVTAAASAPAGGYDFVSRFFAPADGIAEDPVTGSAHTALAPFWSDHLGGAALTGLQASARGGMVRTVVDGDRVHLVGRAVTMLDGALAPDARPPG